MLISIITINYNDSVGLKKTMDSVFKQIYANIEYIVIDGGSTDGSQEYIASNQQSLAYWVSEVDNGVYHAMNKGIRASKGDYLLFLNSGDFLYNNSVLQDVSLTLKSKQDLYYGDIILDKSNGQTHHVKFPKKLSFQFFYEGTLPHQATFIKRKLFDDVFFYNEDLKIVSDWEFFICAICKYNCTYDYLNRVISTYNAIGISSKRENRQIKKQERHQTIVKYFPSFIEDYAELLQLKSTLRTNRFKMLLGLEKSKHKFLKKLVSLVLLVFLKLSGSQSK